MHSKNPYNLTYYMWKSTPQRKVVWGQYHNWCDYKSTNALSYHPMCCHVVRYLGNAIANPFCEINQTDVYFPLLHYFLTTGRLIA